MRYDRGTNLMNSSVTQLWDTCLQEIEPQVTKANFTTWFKNTTINKEEEGIIYITVPNEFVREWMITKYHKLILKTIVDHLDHIRGIEFIIGQVSAPQPVQSKPIEEKPELPLQQMYINRDDNLNPRYTFESFIVGPFNELAYAAAQAVIKNPQNAYNPLFFYGSSGLGKTHLIQAVGNEIKKLFPDKRVFYTTAEKFMNDYTTSVQTNRSNTFREKYRKFDVLIIDDIQFVSGKRERKPSSFTSLMHSMNKIKILSFLLINTQTISLDSKIASKLDLMPV